MRDEALNQPEREFVLATIKKGEEYAFSLEKTIAGLEEQNRQNSSAQLGNRTNANPQILKPVHEGPNNPTEEALNKLDRIKSNSVPITVVEFSGIRSVFVGFFSKTTKIHFRSDSSELAEKLKQELIRLKAEDVVLVTNTLAPGLVGKITYEKRGSSGMALNYSKNIRAVIDRVSPELAAGMQVWSRSELGANSEEGVDADTINVYLP